MEISRGQVWQSNNSTLRIRIITPGKDNSNAVVICSTSGTEYIRPHGCSVNNERLVEGFTLVTELQPGDFLANE